MTGCPMAKAKGSSGHPPKVNLLNLLPEHLADLGASGLNDKIIAEANIKSLSPDEIAAILGKNASKVQSAMLFEYPDTDHFYRMKLFPPLIDHEGHKRKYHQKAGTRSHLYIHPRVKMVLSNPSIPISFVEGEKKTLRAIQEGIDAIGIGGLWSWLYNGDPLPEFDSIAFAGREVAIYPDSDIWVRPDLLKAVYALGMALHERGAKVKIAQILPGPKGERWGIDDLGKIEIDPEKLIMWMSYFSIKDTSFTHPKEWYKKWKEEKKVEKDDGLQGRPLFQREVKPWLGPVDGGRLFEAITNLIRRYVILSEDDAVAIALWIVQTYCIERMTCLPILAVTSATKREGKTTLLEIITAIVARPAATSNISPAALFRMVEAWQPTLICDEMDQQFKVNDDLRILMNASHTRATAFVFRVVGKEMEPRSFNVFGSKAVGLIGKLPGTMSDRSIEIRMRRKMKGEHIARINRTKLEQECSPIRSQIVQWLNDNAEEISEERVFMPTILDDRAADNWRGLFAIALAVGVPSIALGVDVPWPERAQKAALSLSEIRGEDVEFGEELLYDLRDIFDEEKKMYGRGKMFTSAILVQLIEKEERPWPTSRKDHLPINSHQLAGILRGFGIKSKDIRIGPHDKFKGYEREGPMQKAFDTYLAPVKPDTPPGSEGHEETTAQPEASEETPSQSGVQEELPSAAAPSELTEEEAAIVKQYFGEEALGTMGTTKE